MPVTDKAKQYFILRCLEDFGRPKALALFSTVTTENHPGSVASTHSIRCTPSYADLAGLAACREIKWDPSMKRGALFGAPAGFTNAQ
jgi:hypothetical protein